MSDPIGKDKQQDSGVDIFNMKPDTKNTSEHGKTQSSATKPEASRFLSFVSKLGTVHLVIVCAVVTSVWIGWPYVFRGLSSGKSTGTHMLTPYQAMTAASRAQQYQPTSNQPAKSAAVATSNITTTAAVPASNVTATGIASGAPATTVAVASAPGAASVANTQASQPTAKEIELQAKVDDLQGKLATTEAQAAKCPAPIATANSNISKPKHRVRHISTLPHRYVISTTPTATMSIGTGTTKQGDFTLNTIYRDQAWIQNGERTYVVQVGDVIDGMHINHIDSSRRQVVTSLGTIR
ncbi:hypothetical protein [Xylella fastidiosa]|uniref:hypothetical protein n=1 Tax=Xylella fastidiosa TaxID=2371 RepID=UPI000FEC7599|nr:hypothetical protein [Xylella fastidiosa]MRU28298.1 hypothetical protein [Xylella fastidiosa subsp. multiplex]MRU30688.1 hypothetical protein [Xylella fastidiosa subsp. multiplex]UIT53415.1 hypothetical protein LZ753_11615 [Xylella fastidiosa subsp. fastidiosa]